MQDWEELEELDSLGEEEGSEELPGSPEKSGSLTTLPLLQALACVLLVLGLVYLRQTGNPAYEEIVARYRQESRQQLHLPEINLPRWEGGGTPAPSPTPEPSPQPSPAPVGLPGIEVQRI